MSFFGLVDKLLVIGDDSFTDGLSDGIDLGDVTSTPDGDSDVKVLEPLQSKQEDRLHDFDSEGLGLQDFDG